MAKLHPADQRLRGVRFDGWLELVDRDQEWHDNQNHEYHDNDDANPLQFAAHGDLQWGLGRRRRAPQSEAEGVIAQGGGVNGDWGRALNGPGVAASHKRIWWSGLLIQRVRR